ncbi:ROK family protein [Niabella soli]|uniref:ROK family transcriptional regulator n=1 Tax=Niabella soli DSM 19437 TaxID=929713 RepID=W0EZS4_9BACT|nr:ROK family protein [Niabella soli]AHF16300.1 ROK family transcriptional regulator [Niabella soli DSM 19437]
MAVIGLDLGGTKLAVALFAEDGTLLYQERVPLTQLQGAAVGSLIIDQIAAIKSKFPGEVISGAGICIPGIYYAKTGTVWCPNIKGWEQYPLGEQLSAACGSLPVVIDSDRACYILGEAWKGAAQKCTNAIYLSVGTGIGAGILSGGALIRGQHDIAGAIGWMALAPPFRAPFKQYGCFEYSASGEGIIRYARELLTTGAYTGSLKHIDTDGLTTRHIFEAFEQGDALAADVIRHCIQFWGMATANLVSLFDPERIIFGGGVFGPAQKLIPEIREEAAKWAQPVSLPSVAFVPGTLGQDAGLYGAASLVLQKKSETLKQIHDQ